ncbi:uncharacterized protein LOC141607677 [Silene latifolia]|uniref:uncharacterized protein LOC141607677 n=1 Tax=Silene latifolia TaxID=37657 RepID=UPI003D778306
MPTLASHSEPTLASIPKGFKLPTSDTGTFEIRPSYINLVERNLFGGGASEDPAKHMEKFVNYCCSVPLTAGVTQEQVKQTLFPFSLRDDAAERLRDLDMEAHGVTDWNSLALAFYKRYFPPQKTNALRSQITSFKQGPAEDLHEAWVWFLCNQFYNGLYDDHRALLDSAANGRFQDNTNDTNAWKIIDQIAAHTDEYGNPRGSKRGGGTDSAIATQLEEVPCERCGTHGHVAAGSMSALEQVHAYQSFKQGTPYSNFFAKRNQNGFQPTPPHANPYIIPQNRGNQPQGNFNRPPQQQFQQMQPCPQAPNSDMSDIKAMLQQQMAASQKQEALIAQLLAHNKVLDTQIAQLSSQNTSRQPGVLPSKPNKPHETVNAIHLRSGLTYDGPEMSRVNNEVIIEDLDVDAEDESAGEVAVTVPFTELITQIPSYAKFVKEILSCKRSFDEVETIVFTAECSAILQNKSPPKLADPGSFSIPCFIGTHTIDNALCDLDASISVLPLSLAQKIGLTEFRCTNMIVQMADRSLSRPLRILEDVPVRVGKIFIPFDFVVLDIPEDTHTLIILGRTFLHTAGVVIDVRARTLTFKVGGETLTYTQSKVRRAPMQVVPCHVVVDSPTVESCFAITVPLLPHAGSKLEDRAFVSSFAGHDRLSYQEDLGGGLGALGAFFEAGNADYSGRRESPLSRAKK